MIPPSREAISVGTLFNELKMAMMGIYVWGSMILIEEDSSDRLGERLRRSMIDVP
jgi:hypothetical protein